MLIEMEAIKRNNVIIKCAIAVQLLIIILASRTDLKTLWGFDHLRFLPPSYGIAFLLISILVLLILLVPRLDRLANKLIIWTDSLLWNGSRVALAILSLSLTVLFLGFHIRAPLLGDS